MIDLCGSDIFPGHRQRDWHTFPKPGGLWSGPIRSSVGAWRQV